MLRDKHNEILEDSVRDFVSEITDVSEEVSDWEDKIA